MIEYVGEEEGRKGGREEGRQGGREGGRALLKATSLTVQSDYPPLIVSSPYVGRALIQTRCILYTDTHDTSKLLKI